MSGRSIILLVIGAALVAAAIYLAPRGLGVCVPFAALPWLRCPPGTGLSLPQISQQAWLWVSDILAGLCMILFAVAGTVLAYAIAPQGGPAPQPAPYQITAEAHKGTVAAPRPFLEPIR